MSKVYPIAVDGANYTVTVSSGIAFTPNTIAAKYITGATTADGTFATNDLYTFQEDLSVGNDLAVANDVDVQGKIDVVGDVQLNSGPALTSGTGSPEGVKAAAPGSIYMRSDGDVGSTLYIKENGGTGNTGWELAHGGLKSSNWAMPSAAGTMSPGTYYVAGYYDFFVGNDNFSSAATFGTANSSYAAHFMVVAAAGATDTVITVTGTSITDAGVRVTSDTQTISLTNADADVYYETSKKWLGQVSVEKTAGTNREMNYGWCAYWDNSNHDFTIRGGEADWYANATGAFDAALYHHSADGWTYNVGAAPTPADPVFSLATLHSTEGTTVSGEYGKVKVVGGDVLVAGSESEGAIGFITTAANNQINYGQMILVYTD